MSDENGQEPDMSDKELKAANEYAIRNCHAKYADNKELLTEAISTLDDESVDELVYFLKERALNDYQRFNQCGLNRAIEKAFDKMGEWLFNTHSI